MCIPRYICILIKLKDWHNVVFRHSSTKNNAVVVAEENTFGSRAQVNLKVPVHLFFKSVSCDWVSLASHCRERQAKSFVVCWLNVFKADKQRWSENSALLLSWHPLLCLLCQPSLYFSFQSLPLFSLNPFLALHSPGMGWCIQEQSGPHRCGPNLWGAKEERHRVPHVRTGDPVAYTHTSAGRWHHTKQLCCVQKFLCKDQT